MTAFIEVQPTLENYWRSIILFGRNVASYKFALGKSLLELAQQGHDIVSLDNLSEPFSRHVCEHLRSADKQATSRSSRFLDTCRQFNESEIKKDELLDITSKIGFANVIDAFHVVHDGDIAVRFFHDERRDKTKGIRLSDDLFRLAEQYQFRNLEHEVEARWRLVETAWELKLPRHVLSVGINLDHDLIVTNDGLFDRKAITSCRDALNGYQKGKCFYCFGNISLLSNSSDLADVDHFFPHMLKPHGFGDSLDGVWNLVLSCQLCNRGAKGKFFQLPALRFLERLHARNNFYIESSHPLRETLMAQTGNTDSERKQFLQDAYRLSKVLLVQNWTPEYEYEPAF
ncbi:HNH endonuclease [bacterium]|nr:HNH endonuclease [bacterium]